MRTFALIWIGLAVSMLGSALTAFALGVRVFEQTQSATQYALVMACAAVPPLIVLPLVGPIVDRFSRKRLLILCDAGGALATAALAFLAWRGRLELAQACAVVTVLSAANALQWPTWSATVTLLVERHQLGRAGGMTQLANAVSHVAAPLAAGALLSRIGLAGIAALDLATFFVSTLTLALARIPPAPAAAGPRRSYREDLPLGWRYISRHAGLLALLGMFALVNFFSEMASVLFTPFVLGFAGPTALGSIVSLGGLGMLAGGALMAVWGVPARPALATCVFAALGGMAIAAAAFTTSVPALAALVAAYFFCFPLLSGSSQVVWQTAVPVAIQGRVFATRTAIAMSTAPLAPLLAGSLADRVFQPAMMPGGAAAAAFGPLLGIGPGRGIALIFLLAGVLSVIAGLAAAAFAPLRRLDDAAAGPPPLEPAVRPFPVHELEEVES